MRYRVPLGRVVRFASLDVPRLSVCVACLCAFLTPAFAQLPLIYSRSTFNAASYMPAGIPAGAIAQGSIFTVFGANLGPSTPVGPTPFPLQTNLAGVALNVIQGATTVQAIPVFVSASQINAIMPSNAPIGTASLQVVYHNARSNMSPVRIANNAMGIFTALGTGLGPGAIENFVTAANQPLNTPTVSAKLGQLATLYGTGLGPITTPDNMAPLAGSLPTKVEVFVGGISAAVAYSGRSPCCAGIDQVVFTVPANAPQGCWVPVYVRTAGTNISNVVTMAIAPSNTCTTDILPQVTSLMLKGGKFGGAILLRATTHQDVGVLAPLDVTADYHISTGFKGTTTPFPFMPQTAFPPSGTCTAYTLQGDMLDGQPLPSMIPIGSALDLGAPLSVTGPNGQRSLSFFTFSGVRSGYLGGLISNNILPSSLFLDPGAYSLTGFGGLDVGPFTASFTAPQPVAWTNRSQLNAIDRTQPLTLAWTGGPGQIVAIVGFGEDLPTNSSAGFACIAPAGASSFTVPTDFLANLPATRLNPLQSKDVIYLLSLPNATLQNLNASGLDLGLSAFININGKMVVWQ